MKSRERAVPLWALMLACQWLDVLFLPLFVAGIERITPVDGGGYGKVIINADWTHSLLGALLLSALFGAFFAWRWSRRSGVVLGAVVFSHWVLDLFVHRGDLPLLPANAGGFPRLGFGLWRWPAASAVLELAIVLAGSWLYWRAAAATGDLKHARVAAAAVLGSGIVTLALNLMGL